MEFNELSSVRPAERSSEIRARVVEARVRQEERYQGLKSVYNNAQMTSNHIREFCKLDHTGNLLLKNAMTKLNLSARAYDRILKVSRTIADLSGSESINIEHLAEAIQYRSLDRESWAG